MADLIDRQATAKRLLSERKYYDCYRDIGIGLDIARMIVEDYCPTVKQNTPTDTPTDLISRQARGGARMTEIKIAMLIMGILIGVLIGEAVGKAEGRK